MKKRWLLVLIVIVAGGLAAIMLDPTCLVLGFLKQESFYQNRPTTYWRKALLDDRPTV